MGLYLLVINRNKRLKLFILIIALCLARTPTYFQHRAILWDILSIMMYLFAQKARNICNKRSKLRLELESISVFKFNLSQRSRAYPKFPTKFLSVRPSVHKIKPSFVGEIFLWGTEKLIIINMTQWLRPSDRRRKRSWGVKKNTVPKKLLDEEEKFWMWVWSK